MHNKVAHDGVYKGWGIEREASAGELSFEQDAGGHMKVLERQ